MLAEEMEAGGDFVEGFVAAAFAGAEFARGEVVHAVKEVGDVRVLAAERFQDVGAADVHTVETAFEEGPRLAAPLGGGEVRPEEGIFFRVTGGQQGIHGLIRIAEEADTVAIYVISIVPKVWKQCRKTAADKA